MYTDCLQMQKKNNYKTISLTDKSNVKCITTWKKKITHK